MVIYAVQVFMLCPNTSKMKAQNVCIVFGAFFWIKNGENPLILLYSLFFIQKHGRGKKKVIFFIIINNCPTSRYIIST